MNENILEILEIIRTTNDSELVEKLQEYHENDIALAFSSLSDEELDRMYKILPNEMLSEIFTYLDNPEDYIEEMDSEQVADIIEEMDSDDAVDLLEDVSEDVISEIRDLIDTEALEDIRLIRSYDEETVGSLITTNFITIPKTFTVKEAMASVIKQAEENDNLNVIFVLNNDETYYGLILLAELIRARATTALEDIIHTAYPVLFDTELIDDSINTLKEYDLDSIPVLSKENKIMGVITKSDIVELVDSEAKEDYAKFAGLSQNEDLTEGVFASMKKRVPWLIILLFFGLGEALLVSQFEPIIKVLTAVVFFQSMILDMAGNVGTQSLAVAIRNISVTEDLNKKVISKMILKDLLIGVINALIIGIGAFIFVGLYLAITSPLGFTASLAISYKTSFVVGISLMISMTASAFLGVAFPILLTKLKVDPATASGPFITTLNDVVSILIYYGIACLMLL